MSVEAECRNILSLLKQKEALLVLSKFANLLEENKNDETKTFTVKELKELVSNARKETFDEFMALIDTQEEGETNE